MDDVLRDLDAQQAELAGLLAGMDEAGWSAATPCPDWDVADVVLHLAQTNELATASAEGRFAAHLEALAGGPATGRPQGITNVDDGAGWLVDQERGAPIGDLARRWGESVRRLRAALSSQDPSTRVEWVAGQVAIRTLATTRIAETWIHTTDAAAALGVDLPPTERLRQIARLAWRSLPYAFERSGQTMSGPVDFELTGPKGDAWDLRNEGALTVVRGPALDLCRVAGRRVVAADTDLTADGPDAAAVLELVRTFA